MSITQRIENYFLPLKRSSDEAFDWSLVVPFVLLHLLPFAVFFVETHWWRDITIGILLFYSRAFFLCAGYHRYFAHRSYKMGRKMQFFMAFGGTLAAQKGPLWWAAHHRYHHKHSDQVDDVHSPNHGFWWSHMGWFFVKSNQGIRYDLIPDFAKFPELRLLDKYNLVPPFLLSLAIFFFIDASACFIGFFLFLVFSYHATFCINSATHIWGTRRFATSDTSRNNLLFALLTSGEGWHNNHHHYPHSANQGFYWYEIDLSYYILKIFSWMGLVWDLRKPPQKVLQRRLIRDGTMDMGMFQDYLKKALRALENPRSGKCIADEKKIAAIHDLLKLNQAKAQEIMQTFSTEKI